jgi:hypothetical protein
VEAIMKIKRQTLSQSGASAIEFALVLPLLLLFLFGIIEFGALFFDKAMITNASREGARAGIVYSWYEGCEDDTVYGCYIPDTDIIQTVNDYLGIRDASAGMLLSFDASSTVDTRIERPDGNDTGNTLRVIVDYDYGWLLLPKFATSLTSGLSLSATTEMRLE